MSAKFKIIFMSLMIGFILTGCLRTRSEVSPTDQSYLSRKKQQDNQKSKESTVDAEETIRTLNGRIEVLENQVSQLQKENANTADAAKIATLQEALSKMELQIQKLEAEKGTAAPEPITPKAKSSDENLKSALPKSEVAAESNSKKNSYDQAEEFFGKKEWKKAILSYQKFAEEFPKSKLLPDAKYKTGVAFQELGLKDEALSFYEEVQAQYPQTLAGKKSKIRMASLTQKSSSKNKKK